MGRLGMPYVALGSISFSALAKAEMTTIPAEVTAKPRRLPAQDRAFYLNFVVVRAQVLA